MISKHKISDIRKLHQKKFRDEEHLFLVEGRKCVETLLQSEMEVVDLFATESAMESNVGMLSNHSVTCISPTDMARISTLSTPPELLAVVRHPERQAAIPESEPVLVLDRIADPGNLGTIVRTADWFNFRHIVCSPDCVEFYNPKTIQATMGSFVRVVPHYTELVPFLRGQQERRILGAFLNGESLNTFKFQSSDIIVIGSESNGISPEVEQQVSQRITIPSPVSGRATAESLNAAIAAAIIMCRFAQ